jgi:hypothetical protein
MVPVSDPDVIDGVVVSGSAGEIDWDDLVVRQHLADALGMDPGKIWGNTWTWLKSLHLRPEHAAAIDAAAQRSAGADTPVKPFRGHLKDCLAHAGEFRAEREQQAAAAAAEAEAERQAVEQAAREEQERKEKAERDRREREQAQAEFDRLVPELDALVVRYSLGREKGAASELREARLTRDPRDKLRILQQKIDWFQNAMAERKRRAPPLRPVPGVHRGEPGHREGGTCCRARR